MWFIFLIFLCLVGVDSEYVTRKFCKDVNQDQCSVFSVSVDPCNEGPAYCYLKSGKKYAMTLDLTPKFSADNLKLSIRGDVKTDGSFSHIIQGVKDGCGYLTCPVQAEERRIFDVDFMMDKTVTGKFPVQVKLWNAENESQACCFTFNVKV